MKDVNTERKLNIYVHTDREKPIECDQRRESDKSHTIHRETAAKIHTHTHAHSRTTTCREEEKKRVDDEEVKEKKTRLEYT